MTDIEFIKTGLKTIRKWRDLELSRIRESGLTDLSYRPRTGMSELGWVLAHQAAVFDFSLNVLIKGEKPTNTALFDSYRPGTDGTWTGVTLDEIDEYYDSGESAIVEWTSSVEKEEFERVIQEGTAPNFFVGMTIREVIASMFSHVSYHTGQISSLGRDWLQKEKG
jgi:uncharacterized damage-inducible protein DinB